MSKILAVVRGLFNIVTGALGTIVVWVLVVGAFWLFAASVLYIASRVLPLRRQQKAQRDAPVKLIYLAPVGIVVALCVLVAYRRANGLCDNSNAREYISPDHATKVVVFTRTCGATTGFSTQVSVLPASASLPNESGNAFIADSNHGSISGRAGPDLAVQWVDAKTVELSHHADARVFKATRAGNGVTIVYSTWR